MSSIVKSRRVALCQAIAPEEVISASDGGRPSAGLQAQPSRPADVEAVTAPPANPADEIERARALGYEEGLRLGRDEGALQAQREAEGLLATARSILEEVTRWKQAQACQDLPQVVALATAIAERVIRRAVQLDADIVIRTLEEAIRQREARDLVRIAVNPDQVEAIRERWRSIQPAASAVEIVADPSVAPGGCLLLCQSSVIDAQIPTQLDVISRELQAQRL